MEGLFFSGGLSQTLGIYELNLQELLLENLGPGSVFYDVGANVGYFSLLASRLVGQEGAVYAFEPFPPNVEKIKELVRRNRAWNIKICSLALWKMTGTQKLHFGRNSATPSLVARTNAQILEVRTTTLDEVTKKHDKPTLIKIDVEGAELGVLNGGGGLLASNSAPTLIIEVHSEENDNLLRTSLREFGYNLTDLPHPRAKQKSYPSHRVAWKRTKQH
jgi:FkbM family methyltransferase